MINDMPQMADVLGGWLSPITLTKKTQSIVSGLPVITESSVSFQGVIQPLSPEAITLKPEGQRSWEWLQIHISSGAQLNVNDIIVYNNNDFKVMARRDYSQSGYIEYHAVREFS